MNRKRGTEDDERERGSDEVDRPLRRAGEARRPPGGEGDERQALDVVHPDGRAHRLEQTRNEVDLDVEVAHRVDELELAAVRLVRERDDDALHVVAIDDRADLVGGPEHGDPGQIAAHRLRIVVDEADEAQPELRMLGDLPPEELADVARSDDERVLQEPRAPPCDRASDRPRAEHAGDRDGPEDDEEGLRDVRAGDRRRDEDRPRARATRSRGPGRRRPSSSGRRAARRADRGRRPPRGLPRAGDSRPRRRATPAAAAGGSSYRYAARGRRSRRRREPDGVGGHERAAAHPRRPAAASVSTRWHGPGRPADPARTRFGRSRVRTRRPTAAPLQRPDTHPGSPSPLADVLPITRRRHVAFEPVSHSTCSLPVPQYPRHPGMKAREPPPEQTPNKRSCPVIEAASDREGRARARPGGGRPTPLWTVPPSPGTEGQRRHGTRSARNSRESERAGRVRADAEVVPPRARTAWLPELRAPGARARGY